MLRTLTRWGFVALAWFALVPVVQAQFVVFTVQSVDAVLDQMRHTLKLAGKEEEAKQIDGMLQAYLSDDGLKGLDTKRPLGIYLSKFEKLDPQKPPLVAFIPVTNEQDFIALLGKLNIPILEADKDGFRRIHLGPVTVCLRFAHGHAFAALDEELLKAEIPDPAKMLPADHRKNLLALTANLDAMPQSLKDQVLDGLAKEMDKQAKEAGDDKARQQSLKGQKMVHESLRQFLNETREVSLTAHHDRQARKLRMDFVLTPRPGTKMAQQVKNFGASRSQFAALAEDAALNFFLHFPIDAETRAALDTTLEEAFQDALKEEKSLAKKAVAEKVFAVLAPTLKSDTFDLFATLRGPRDDKFTLVAGLRVKNGQEIEQLLKNLLNDMPEKDRANVQLDAEKVDGLSVHKITFPEGDKDARRIFGSSQIFVVFHKDYALFTVGQHGLEELKKAMSQVGTPGQKQFAPMHLNASIRRLMHFEENEAKRSKAIAAAKSVFTGPEDDLIQFTWSGDTTMRLRFEMSDQIIKFFALLDGDENE